MKKTFQLTEVDCGLCAQRIEDAVLRVEGVNAALAERIYANLHGLPSPEAGAE